MSIPITQLDFCGEPVDLYCPVCGERLFSLGVPQKSCPHVIFLGDSASGNWSWEQQQYRQEFNQQIEKNYEEAGQNGFYGTPEEYIKTIKVDTIAAIAAMMISRKSACMLAISTSDIGCGGMYNGTIYAAFDFLPENTTCPIRSAESR